MNRMRVSHATEVVQSATEPECEAIGAFLADRIYAFNVNATGYDDGLLPYERMGYERKFAIEGSPTGHVDIVYVKALHILRG